MTGAAMLGEASSQVGFQWIWQLQPIFRQMAVDMGVSTDGGTPKSSILLGFSFINYPAMGFPPWNPPCHDTWWKRRSLVRLLGCSLGLGGLHYTGAWKGLREPRWDTQTGTSRAQPSDVVFWNCYQRLQHLWSGRHVSKILRWTIAVRCCKCVFQ